MNRKREIIEKQSNGDGETSYSGGYLKGTELPLGFYAKTSRIC